MYCGISFYLTLKDYNFHRICHDLGQNVKLALLEIPAEVGLIFMRLARNLQKEGLFYSYPGASF